MGNLMRDMLGQELSKGDLVAFASPRGSNSRQRIAVVVDPDKKSVFSLYTYRIGNELQYVYSTRPGHGVSEYKLVLLDRDMYEDLYASLREKVAKWL